MGADRSRKTNSARVELTVLSSRVDFTRALGMCRVCVNPIGTLESSQNEEHYVIALGACLVLHQRPNSHLGKIETVHCV